MERIFLPFDICAELSKNGFNEECIAHNGELNGGEVNLFIRNEMSTFHAGQFGVLTPSYLQVIDWFMKEHKLFLSHKLLDRNNDPIIFTFTCYDYAKDTEEIRINANGIFTGYCELIRSSLPLIK